MTANKPTHKKSTFISILVCASILCAGFALTACSTMEGLGKDIKTAGNALERKAKDVKDGD